MQKKILQIDSGTESAKLLKTFLEAEGYKVYITWDEPSSLIVLKNEKPDLVLIDILMQDMSAWNFFRKMLKICPAAKLILTGVVPISPERKNDLIQSGICDYIHRPCDIKEVITKIIGVLEEGYQ
jgi:DNA-binding response OmpR family regulator